MIESLLNINCKIISYQIPLSINVWSSFINWIKNKSWKLIQSSCPWQRDRLNKSRVWNLAIADFEEIIFDWTLLKFEPSPIWHFEQLNPPNTIESGKHYKMKFIFGLGWHWPTKIDSSIMKNGIKVIWG